MCHANIKDNTTYCANIKYWILFNAGFMLLIIMCHMLILKSYFMLILQISNTLKHTTTLNNKDLPSIYNVTIKY